MTSNDVMDLVASLGLHPKVDPLGDDHHTDVPFSEQDKKYGELAWFLGTLFADTDDDPSYWHKKRTSVDEWRRIARALRVHGLVINDATALEAAESREAKLRKGLRDLSRAYVSLLETGRDRIIASGGQCDPVDVMEAADPALAAACVLLYRASERDAQYLKIIVRRIGNKRVRDLTPAFVRQLARDMLPYASTDTWQREVVTPIRSVINNAHDLGKCPPIRVRAYSKAERVEQDVLRGKQSRVPKTPGSWPWVLAFCEAAAARDAALAYFMFRHGYRVSQSIAMTRSRDMDLSAGRVRVHASKGHPAHWVDLDPEEVAMIASLPVPYRGQAKDRVFTIAGGRSGALYARWKEACARAGIAYLPPHSCGRHGYGTEMVVRQGVDPVSAAENLWSDPSVMLRTYSHSDDAKARVRDAFKAGKDAARSKPAARRRVRKA